MSDYFQPRLDYIDVDLSRSVLEKGLEYLPILLDMIRTEPRKLGQTRHASLASLYEQVAQQAYALGHPLSEVRDYISHAVVAHVKVFELRGTESPFPVVVVEPDPRLRGGPPAYRMRPQDPVGAKDHSVTNSRQSYDAACLAWIAGQFDVGTRFALEAWDPPDDGYIGSGSFCTRNDQRLAYALRDILKGNCEAAVTLIRGVVSARGEHTEVLSEATMLHGLLTRDRRMFLQGLTTLLTWHQWAATLKGNEFRSNYFLCMTGLGLSALAVRQNILRPDDLPRDNVFAPVELPNWATF